MTSFVEGIEKESLALLLRSKTALGRLNDAEVHSILAFLEIIGFKHHASAPVAPIEPGPVDALTPEIQQAAQVAQVIPVVAPALAPPPAQ